MLKIKHQKKDPFVPPISISALFNLSCFLHNKNVAIDQNEFRITRKQIKHDKKILVRALLALGIKKGDIITVATGRPIYECIFLFISANNPMRPMAIHIAPIVLAVKYKKIPITNHKMNNRQPKFSLDIFITSSSACST